MLTADSSIEDIGQDRYNRAAIAHRFAEALNLWDGTSGSLVTAIYGPWGSGKTALKNLTINRLRKLSPGFIVRDFNPWMCNGVEQMTDSFFESLVQALDEQDESKLNNKVIAEAKQDVKKLGQMMQAASATVKLAKETGNAILKLGPLILAANPDTREWLQQFLPLLTVSQVEKFLKTDPLFQKEGLLQNSENVLEAATQWVKTQDVDPGQKCDLFDTAKRLKGLFATLSKRMLIVIDDIDRLNPMEIRILFQMIKANSDFPKLAFVLMCDRNYVEHCLAESMPSSLDTEEPSGRRFLDKIIHCGITVPAYSQDLIRKDAHSLFDQLRAIDQEFSREDFNASFDLLRPYILTPRNLVRFSTALTFQANLLVYETGKPIVHLADLVLLECIRVFEPQLHEQIAQNREILDLNSDYNNILNSLETYTRQQNRVLIRKVLKVLFPDTKRTAPFDKNRITNAVVFERYYYGMDENTRYGS